MIEFAKVDPDEIAILIDDDGIAELNRLFDACRKTGHEHMFDAAWDLGGWELQVSDENSFSKVTVYLRYSKNPGA